MVPKATLMLTKMPTLTHSNLDTDCDAEIDAEREPDAEVDGDDDGNVERDAETDADRTKEPMQSSKTTTTAKLTMTLMQSSTVKQTMMAIKIVRPTPTVN
jgi:hypothetical protein